jgi:hypothetical protein
MRRFRSHRIRVGWLACIALTCHLALSFGHIHVGKAVGKFGIAAFLVSQGLPVFLQEMRRTTIGRTWLMRIAPFASALGWQVL